MKIKLLSPVLHDGHLIEPGETGDIDPEIAATLIASGAAVAMEIPQVAGTGGGNDAGNTAPKEPEPNAQHETGAAGTEAKTEHTPAADPKATEPETGKKAAKAEGK